MREPRLEESRVCSVQYRSSTAFRAEEGARRADGHEVNEQRTPRHAIHVLKLARNGAWRRKAEESTAWACPGARSGGAGGVSTCLMNSGGDRPAHHAPHIYSAARAQLHATTTFNTMRSTLLTLAAVILFADSAAAFVLRAAGRNERHITFKPAALHRRRQPTMMAQQVDGVRVKLPPDAVSQLLHNRIIYIGMRARALRHELVVAQLLYLNYESPEQGGVHVRQLGRHP